MKQKKHESEDKDKREKIDLVNQSEHLIYETEKNVKEHADKLEESEKTDLDEKVKALNKAKESGNIDNIRSSMDALNASWSAVASKLYDPAKQESNTSEEQTDQDPSKKEKKEGEIEDADFEVVD